VSDALWELIEPLLAGQGAASILASYMLTRVGRTMMQRGDERPGMEAPSRPLTRRWGTMSWSGAPHAGTATRRASSSGAAGTRARRRRTRVRRSWMKAGGDPGREDATLPEQLAQVRRVRAVGLRAAPGATRGARLGGLSQVRAHPGRLELLDHEAPAGGGLERHGDRAVRERGEEPPHPGARRRLRASALQLSVSVSSSPRPSARGVRPGHLDGHGGIPLGRGGQDGRDARTPRAGTCRLSGHADGPPTRRRATGPGR
jgi:hypothetical protein